MNRQVQSLHVQHIDLSNICLSILKVVELISVYRAKEKLETH